MKEGTVVRTSPFHPCLHRDTSKDDSGTSPLPESKFVVVYDNGEDHREQFSSKCNCPTKSWTSIIAIEKLNVRLTQALSSRNAAVSQR